LGQQKTSWVFEDALNRSKMPGPFEDALGVKDVPDLRRWAEIFEDGLKCSKMGRFSRVNNYEIGTIFGRRALAQPSQGL
jgi:hypothetical protein